MMQTVEEGHQVYPIHTQCVRFAATQYPAIIGVEIDFVDVRLYCGREFIRVYSGSANVIIQTL